MTIWRPDASGVLDGHCRAADEIRTVPIRHHQVETAPPGGGRRATSAAAASPPTDAPGRAAAVPPRLRLPAAGPRLPCPVRAPPPPPHEPPCRCHRPSGPGRRRRAGRAGGGRSQARASVSSWLAARISGQAWPGRISRTTVHIDLWRLVFGGSARRTTMPVTYARRIVGSAHCLRSAPQRPDVRPLDCAKSAARDLGVRAKHPPKNPVHLLQASSAA